MGDALDDGEFEAYEPEPEGELEGADQQEAAPMEPGNGDSAANRKKKRKRGKKKKKGSAGAAAAAGEGQEGEGGAAVADADADDDAAAAADEDDEDGDGEGGGEDGGGKKKKKRKRPRKKGPGSAAAAMGDATTAEGQAALLWERYCELLDVSPLDRDVQRFPPARFVLPSAAPAAVAAAAAAAAAAAKKGKDKAAVPETGITDFLRRTLPGLQKLASDKAHRVVGRPLVVIVSPAAVRANDLAKELRVRLPNQRTAKLFAKHIKVKEQAEALQKEFNALAVGTPNRLSKLMEAGALSLGNCRLLVLDASFKDAKEFTILTLPGVAKDVALLLRDHVLPAMGNHEALRIAMF